MKQPNVEQPIFRNFEISNIKTMKDGSVFFIFEFLLYFHICLNYSKTKYMMIYEIGNLWNFDSFPNCKKKIIFSIFRNLAIAEI